MRKLLIVFGLLLTSLASLAEVAAYKWIDESGVTNVSELPPPRSCQSSDCVRIHARLKHELDTIQGEKTLKLEQRIEEQKRKDEELEIFMRDLKQSYEAGVLHGQSIKFKFAPGARGYAHCGSNKNGKYGLKHYKLREASIAGCREGFDGIGSYDKWLQEQMQNAQKYSP
jgi:hypothetical protein